MRVPKIIDASKFLFAILFLIGSQKSFSQVDFNIEDAVHLGQSNTSTKFSFSKNFAKSESCQEFVRYAQNEMNTSGLIVLKDSKSVLELYARGAGPKTKTKVWSISKFLSGLMLGALVNQHSLNIMDEPLENFGIKRKPKYNDKVKDWSKVTLRNVWNMSSGLNWCEYENCRAKDAAHIMYGKANSDTVKYVLNQDLIYEPGTYYRYSAGNYVLLQKAIKDFYDGNEQKYLRSPYDLILKHLDVSFEDYAFEVDKKNIIMGGSGLSLTARGLAKLGQLLSNQGVYKGKKIIPLDFFEEMTTNSEAIKSSPFAVQNWEGPAGGSIWLNDDSTNADGQDRDGIPSFMPRSPYTMLYAGGNFGQFLLVYPESDLIIARLGGDKSQSKHWAPFSNKALKCFAPDVLRDDINNGVEKKAPDTGKMLGFTEIIKNSILIRARAQEMCSCLFVTGYKSIEKCDKMVPTKTQLFSFINNHNIVTRPYVDWENKTVTVRRKLSFEKATSRFNKENTHLGCQLTD